MYIHSKRQPSAASDGMGWDGMCGGRQLHVAGPAVAHSQFHVCVGVSISSLINMQSNEGWATGAETSLPAPPVSR